METPPSYHDPTVSANDGAVRFLKSSMVLSIILEPAGGDGIVRCTVSSI